jgi:hypothetical protein
VFDGLADQVGDFSYDEALAAAVPTFFELVQSGVPPEEAGEYALAAGAEAAAALHEGRPLVEALIQAELERVGVDVNKQAIWQKAEEYVGGLIDQGLDETEAAAQAVTYAASDVAEIPGWRNMDPRYRAQSVARYYGAKAQVLSRMEQAGQPKPRQKMPEVPGPGQPMTIPNVSEIARKWGR